jgi:hypothetical protein
MSAVAQTPAPTTDPDPHRAGAGVPAAVGRVLLLVRKLIDYGKQLAATVQQRVATSDFAFYARPFGTADLAVILARITSGLRRAAALEDRLCQRAGRGRDLVIAPIRLPAVGGAHSPRQAPPPDAQSEPRPADPAEDPRLARLPTEEEIAAEVRRRPIGAVIVDICCDLGIAPGHLDAEFWGEIRHAIMMYGGSLVSFVQDLDDRLFAFFTGGHLNRADPGWPGPLPILLTPATGPP